MPDSPMSLSEHWRLAAHDAANRGFEGRHPAKLPVGRDRSALAADAAVRVALEHLNGKIRDRIGHDEVLAFWAVANEVEALLKEATHA